MHFCNKCNNMYYIKIQDNDCNKISYYCRNCGNNEDNLIDSTKCVLKEIINKNDNNKSDMFINKYTKFDKTLPRINYIKCPNSKCSSNNKDFDINNREILYIRHDHINMKYIYLCSHCDYIWNTDK